MGQDLSAVVRELDNALVRHFIGVEAMREGLRALIARLAGKGIIGTDDVTAICGAMFDQLARREQEAALYEGSAKLRADISEMQADLLDQIRDGRISDTPPLQRLKPSSER